MAALFPKVNDVGELMLGKGMGSGGPRSLGAMVDDQPRGYTGPDASTQSWQWARDLLLPLASRPTETLQPLKKCYQAV